MSEDHQQTVVEVSDLILAVLASQALQDDIETGNMVQACLLAAVRVMVSASSDDRSAEERSVLVRRMTNEASVSFGSLIKRHLPNTIVVRADKHGNPMN